MKSSNTEFLVPPIQISAIIVFLLLLTPTSAQQFNFQYNWCGQDNYSPNSPYGSNLKSLLNTLSSEIQTIPNTNGFYNLSQGEAPYRANSLAICRGDVPLDTCKWCIQQAASQILSKCPNMSLFGFSEYCTVYFSNKSLSGTVQDAPQWNVKSNGPNISDISVFNTSLQSLLGSLSNRAASSSSSSSGNAQKKYAAGNISLADGNTLYGLAQCTPDLNRSGCLECLSESQSAMMPCCPPGVKVVAPSCFLRYDETSFSGNVPIILSTPPTQPPPSSNTTSAGSKRKSSNASKIGIPIPIVGSLLVIVGIGVWMWAIQRKKKLRKSRTRLSKDEIKSLESLQFSFGVIKHATEDFKDENVLGQGGFGVVYKGVLPNGDEIAVKRLSRNSGKEGDVQFKNEIAILAKLQHKNLVRLLGFCLHEEEMLLIYEFVSNSSLDKFLFDPIRRESMLWETRYKIISGIAKGILYLHEESRLRIIHRDLKAGNVLLDAEFNPKIADFGMARLFNMDQTQTMTSRVVGTYGYMPPEYVLYGQVSVKSDVFSFGVLVLEIICGQKISSFVGGNDSGDLLSYAWRSWTDGTAWNMVDKTLSSGFSSEILRCIHIGLLCVQDNPVDRPTMSLVIVMLSNHSSALSAPFPPAFYTDANDSRHNNLPLQENTSSSISTGCSVNDVTISQFIPR